MTPTTQKTVLAAIGTVVATLPFVVPALEPYQLLMIGIGTAMGGAALVKRPGDTAPPKTAPEKK
jgi:hypothetical protein